MVEQMTDEKLLRVACFSGACFFFCLLCNVSKGETVGVTVPTQAKSWVSRGRAESEWITISFFFLLTGTCFKKQKKSTKPLSETRVVKQHFSNHGEIDMKQALLYEPFDGKIVRCFLCAHNCRIEPDHFGFCSVRQNVDGKLYTHAYGRAIAQQIDPVEKKPLYHFLPGTDTFSLSTIGCNFRCGFCQNWQISQLGVQKFCENWGQALLPEKIVAIAKQNGCRSISFTYTEPTIFFEYALATCRLAKEQGIKTVFVSNGYMTQQALEMIAPWLDAINVDLKAFSDNFYRKFCKAHLTPVLETLKNVLRAGIWLEVTTLLVTAENDSPEELDQIASFIAFELGKGVPWHISRFFPQYEMIDYKPTPAESLQLAMETGQKHGLKYIYAGNVAGPSNTICSNCGEVLVKREGYTISQVWHNPGVCGRCGERVEGCFS